VWYCGITVTHYLHSLILKVSKCANYARRKGKQKRLNGNFEHEIFLLKKLYFLCEYVCVCVCESMTECVYVHVMLCCVVVAGKEQGPLFVSIIRGVSKIKTFSYQKVTDFLYTHPPPCPYEHNLHPQNWIELHC